MRKLALFCVTLVVGLSVVGLAPAQTGDAHPDGNAHPNVGALLRARADGSLTIVCSGALVAPRSAFQAYFPADSPACRQRRCAGCKSCQPLPVHLHP